MNLFTFLRDTFVAKRIDDQSIYADALREIESGIRRDGLWAKALAASNGDERKAKASYIEFVVAAMHDETYISRRLAEEEALKLKQNASAARMLREDTEQQLVQQKRQEALAIEEQRRQYERRLYEAQGARAKRIGWLFAIPGWICGVVGFQLAGSELFVSLFMSAILVAPASGLIAFLVASLVIRGVRPW